MQLAVEDTGDHPGRNITTKKFRFCFKLLLPFFHFAPLSRTGTATSATISAIRRHSLHQRNGRPFCQISEKMNGHVINTFGKVPIADCNNKLWLNSK